MKINEIINSFFKVVNIAPFPLPRHIIGKLSIFYSSTDCGLNLKKKNIKISGAKFESCHEIHVVVSYNPWSLKIYNGGWFPKLPTSNFTSTRSKVPWTSQTNNIIWYVTPHKRFPCIGSVCQCPNKTVGKFLISHRKLMFLVL